MPTLYIMSAPSYRKNGEEIASIFDQNHKDNHKNSMAGQTIIIDAQRGDEVSEIFHFKMATLHVQGDPSRW